MTTPTLRCDIELPEFLDNHHQVQLRSLLPEGIDPLRDALVSGESSLDASPFHHPDLTRLPPRFLDVENLELFRAEMVTWAENATPADVPVEFHLWMGAFHGFPFTHPAAQKS